MAEIASTSVQRAGAILLRGAASEVLREAFFRVRRFDDFQSTLGLSRSVLSRTLKALVEQGLFERRLYQTRPDRYEYHLTQAGLELYPVFLAMKEWGDRWLGADASDVVLEHRLCGSVTHPRMTCDACAAPVHARDVAYTVIKRDRPEDLTPKP